MPSLTKLKGNDSRRFLLKRNCLKVEEMWKLNVAAETNGSSIKKQENFLLLAGYRGLVHSFFSKQVVFESYARYFSKTSALASVHTVRIQGKKTAEERKGKGEEKNGEKK
jgi:hypothetical protein